MTDIQSICEDIKETFPEPTRPLQVFTERRQRLRDLAKSVRSERMTKLVHAGLILAEISEAGDFEEMCHRIEHYQLASFVPLSLKRSLLCRRILQVIDGTSASPRTSTIMTFEDDLMSRLALVKSLNHVQKRVLFRAHLWMQSELRLVTDDLLYFQRCLLDSKLFWPIHPSAVEMDFRFDASARSLPMREVSQLLLDCGTSKQSSTSNSCSDIGLWLSFLEGTATSSEREIISRRLMSLVPREHLFQGKIVEVSPITNPELFFAEWGGRFNREVIEDNSGGYWLGKLSSVERQWDRTDPQILTSLWMQIGLRARLYFLPTILFYYLVGDGRRESIIACITGVCTIANVMNCPLRVIFCVDEILYAAEQMIERK